MKQSDIIHHADADNTDIISKFPYDTDYMKYRAAVSRYFLTNQTLEDYGISPIGYNGTKAQQIFIEEVSDDLYGVMARFAPYNFQYNSYLVAQSYSLLYPNRHACRNEFQKALIYQAQYKVKTLDVRNFNGIDMDNAGNKIDHKTLRKELRHISPKALDILQALGLLFNGNIPNKHLINYKEQM